MMGRIKKGNDRMSEFSAETKEKQFSWAKIFYTFAVIIVILASGFLYEVFLPHANYHGEKQVEIPPGFGSRMIGDLLKENGVIQSKWAFVTYATLKNEASSLKPGTYVFSETAAIPEILESLVNGEKYSNERFLTIREGWGVREIAHYLVSEGIAAEPEDVWAVTGAPAVDYGTSNARLTDFSRDFSFLKDKPSSVGLEGFLFPDTYRVFRNATVEDIVRKMLDNFGRRVNGDLLLAIHSQNKSLFDVITVASLLEKEIPGDRDRAIVSGILWQRLRLGLSLQVDATLVYIRGHNHDPLTAKDKSVNSRFNTYKYAGLPLGPISNPGLSAIRAAVFPAESPYLYYLSAPSGEVIYSKTLAEHNAAKAKYLR